MSNVLTRLTCPGCGKSAITSRTIAKGSRVRCPSCQAIYTPTDSMISGIAARSAITEARTQPEKVDSQAFLSREQPGGPSHPGEPDTKDCPYCGEQILAVARKCKHCSEFLDETIRPQQQIEATTTVHLHQHPQVNKDSWSPGVAAVLSLVIPGAGQMYKGQIGSGFVWLVGVTLGYLLMIAPGLILHILCVVMAATVKTK